MIDDSYDKKNMRKKLVDIKAVAALLDENEDNVTNLSKKVTTYTPNEDLIQETARIKTQRDLILDRIHKMQQSREKVSKNVFDKVNRDYGVQLDSINQLLGEKKSLLNKELKNLYLLREKENVEINRHREILEEAQFRHYLNEFTEDQYHEVEEYETREIEHRQAELAKINSFIKIHEELFDPDDLGPSYKKMATSNEEEPKQPSTPRSDILQKFNPEPEPKWEAKQPEQAEVTRTVQQPPVVAKAPTVQTPVAPPPLPQEEPVRVEEVKEPSINKIQHRPIRQDEDFEKTPLPTQNPVEEENLLPPPDKTEAFNDKTQTNHADESQEEYKLPPEQNYFEQAPEPSIKTQINVPVSDLPPSSEPSITEAQNVNEQPKAEKKEPDSILDILNDIQLESDLAGDAPKATATSQNSVSKTSVSTAGSGGYKLVTLEGEFDAHEFPLKDNISIGRSPSNDIVLKAPKVSRQHAAINKYKDNYILIDLKSSNGVYVNGKKIEEHTLADGDEVSISGYRMVFKKN